ncbi:putative D-methionine-binding lipoprotein MetQ [Sporomusa silvacetica DSM 10669]|uniref:Lipoprotein n=1 Tax=Sporomusa silvacetica DSM 10669 TaxID=1123289 RepID=A0ABZ3IH41_9FIRM|nr:MetQ/NlpA family ABC transporter substrate-binding protein [Sporomusa silvacetica]OZC14836.1 putative D-methionine-binding lipoprotein MetQ precursor [Sporomusa silvacetica DSM 10669]
MNKRKISMLTKFLLMITTAVFLAGCSNSDKQPTSGNQPVQQRTQIKLGVTPSVSEEVIRKVKEVAAKDGLDIEVIVFSDYTQVNRALAEKQLDANSFQHTGFFENDKKTHNLDLVKIADTYTLPAAIYSKKIKNVSELPDGATVALAGDPANTARGLYLFEKAGWIKLREGAGVKATVRDIVDNPKKLKFKEMDQAMVLPMLGEVDAAAVNSNFALAAGLNPQKDGLVAEDANGPWVNLLAVRTAEKDDPVFQKLVKAFRSAEVKQFINDKYKGSVLASW